MCIELLSSFLLYFEEFFPWFSSIPPSVKINYKLQHLRATGLLTTGYLYVNKLGMIAETPDKTIKV